METEIQKIETCVQKLPAGHVKTTATGALEKVSTAMDPVPRALVSPVTTVASGCTKVQNFLAKIHLVKRKRGLPVLSQAISKILAFRFMFLQFSILQMFNIISMYEYCVNKKRRNYHVPGH